MAEDPRDPDQTTPVAPATPPPASQPDAEQPSERPPSDAILPFGERLDEIAQERFNRTDWIELAAAVLLALATVMAAWAAYQSTRWGGEQANAFSAAGAARTEAAQATSIAGSLTQIDVQLWTLWLDVLNLEFRNLAVDPSGTSAPELLDATAVAFVAERFRDEFKPAQAAWLALEPPPGLVLPLGTPFDMEEYVVAERVRAEELNATADAAAARARDANQTGDNFVLVAVIMASVLFFAGVGTKFKGRGVRLVMLLFAALAFLGGISFMFSMPQNVGL